MLQGQTEHWVDTLLGVIEEEQVGQTLMGNTR